MALKHCPKDGVADNRHPLNLSTLPIDGDPTRPPLYEVYMRMAEDLAKRSTCSRLRVGTVVTDALLENVLGIGYNGNAKGLDNRCDSNGQDWSPACATLVGITVADLLSAKLLSF